jgi:hypothetical protein
VPRPLAEHEVWRTSTAGWGNASPVLLGAQVCFTEEPTTLRCVRAADGASAWQATNDYADALMGAEADAWRAKLAELPALRGEVDQAKRELSRLRRASRRADSEVSSSDLSAASVRLDQARMALDALTPFLTPPDKDIIGYGSPTPVVADGRIYALFGNGVVSCFEEDGRRVWSRYLGPPAAGMLGYDNGTSSSPLRVGDTLVVAHGHLFGLDAKTGDVRWKDDADWKNYGAPAVLQVGSGYVLTPDGRAVRVADGAVAASGLGEIWFGGPLVDGDVGYWLGGKGRADQREDSLMVAHRFREEGGSLRSIPLWRHTFPVASRVYMSPVLHDGRIHTATHDLDVVTVSAQTGERLHVTEPPKMVLGTAYQGVSRVGDELVVLDDLGNLVGLSLTASPEVTWTEALGVASRSTPIFVGGRMYVRTLEDIRAFE